MAADHDLVAVRQRAPFDALAVDEHAVEAAIVEYAQPVGLANDQRVAARDCRVVESDVGCQAAPDPRPFALKRKRDHLTARRSVGEVLAGLVEAIADLVKPALVLGFGRHVDHRRLRRREQRSAYKLGAAGVGAGWQLGHSVERYGVVALGTAKCPGPRYVARHPSFHL